MARTRGNANCRGKKKEEDEEGSDVDESTMDSSDATGADLPPKPVESMQRKLVIGKASSFAAGTPLYSLRHPRSNAAALFHLSATECDEVLLLEDEYRALLHGDTVVGDGRTRMLAPFNPLLLAMPYLEKKRARYETLEEILKDEELPACERLAANGQMMRELEMVADKTDACDEVLYKLNERKALDWIAGRFAALRAALVAHARLHDSITANPDVLDRYAFGVLADHLTPAMAAAAKERLDIKEAPVAEPAPEPLGMKRKLDDDENLYSAAMPPAKKTPTQSVQQKRLAQASKGTKSLASFFGKKAN